MPIQTSKFLRLRSTSAAALVLLIYASSSIHSQRTASHSEVRMTVTITDKDGRYVGGLSKNQISIWDDKVEQQASVFEVDNVVPVSVGFIFDTTRIKQAGLSGLLEESVLRFVATSERTNEYLMIGMNSKPNLISDLTKERNQIVGGLTWPQTNQSNKRALYDAIRLGLEKLEVTGGRKRVLFLVSDDKDDASSLKRDELLELLKKSDVSLYAIRVVVPGGNNLQSDVLNELCSTTGGVAWYPTTAGQFKDAFETVSLELKHQYSVTFFPSGQLKAGEWHQLEIKVKPLETRKSPTSKDIQKVQLFARTRKGFYVRF